MLVRLMMERDIPRVAALGQMQCLETTPHMRFNIDRTLKTLQGALKAEPTIFVAERNPDRRVVGYLIAHVHDYMHADGFMVEQEILYVDPEVRATFLGGRAAVALLDVFVSWARSMSPPPNEIYTGVANGIDAERKARFFQKRGFEPVGTYLRSIH